ncbi:hypothetical protein WL27_26260 [Burkholderia multivorans]|uniref:hypothetical protein n=1 Tax=Burkholderia multivorans TaxID=87883 RepID=UPI0007590A6A|nr:hypothetical protein [Burkholderia multivorans]KWA30269.1 hypothetical protein WL27_26260 [Burkholderia multivorans]
MSIQAINGQPPSQAAAVASTPSQQTKGAAQSTTTTQAGSSASSTASASYSVSISSTARAALAEATETSVQTAKEAHGGDIQAQRLLAKEQAQKAG